MPTKDESITELARALVLVWRRLRTESSSEDQAITLTHASALARLDKLGPLTTADLARAEGMKPQSMGTIVAVLEDNGLVARKPHPTDGRQMLIELTSAGAALRKKTRDAKLAWLVSAIGKLDRDEQATLFAAGPILKKLVEP